MEQKRAANVSQNSNSNQQKGAAPITDIRVKRTPRAADEDGRQSAQLVQSLLNNSSGAGAGSKKNPQEKANLASQMN
jgi:hypothetical protein